MVQVVVTPLDDAAARFELWPQHCAALMEGVYERLNQLDLPSGNTVPST